MADIFLSYAREDLEKAQLLADALLAQGWSVFWDMTSILAGHDIDEVVEAEIEKACCMIVCWSNKSVKSDWVRGEASIGRERRILVPVLFESVKPPIAFRSLHTEEFSGWNGNSDDNVFQKLISAVSRLVEPDKQNKQVATPHLQNPQNQTSIIIPKMVTIPAGSFEMGSNDYKDEKPVHSVTIKKPFALGAYPVTFEEYDNYVKHAGADKPKSSWGRGKQPVTRVNWKDAVGYAEWLSKQTGKQYRLPTEAEWEYAARAGTKTDYYWEDGNIKEYAWFNENSDGKTHTVGGKRPNSFGLYDMSGNVLEWVQDCWHDNYKKAPDDGSAWEQADGGDCTRRVLRGGSWFFKPVVRRTAPGAPRMAVASPLGFVLPRTYPEYCVLLPFLVFCFFL